MKSITDDEFIELIEYDLKNLVSILEALAKMTPEEINRPLLGRLYMESGKCEELLDSLGIKLNKRWFKLRNVVAGTKSFSKVSYNLLHLRYASPHYRLLEVDGDFFSDIETTIEEIFSSFIEKCKCYVEILSSLSMLENLRPISSYRFKELDTDRKLVNDRDLREVDNMQEMATYLATTFLNHAERSDFLKIYRKVSREEYHSCIPDIINEENLRLLENQFHNLQAKYDTYLFNTKISIEDSNLPVLRGQVSVIYHLLDTVTLLIHYSERHGNTTTDGEEIGDKILHIIMEFFVRYADQYIVAAQNLCRGILKSYAEQGEITLPIPNYRGFHVRPSTLIAKIVIHYGSEVGMQLGQSCYNAAMPLELFRANEELNLKKRKHIAADILNNKYVKNDSEATYEAKLMKKILRLLMLDLLEKKKIILYENDFSFEDLTPFEGESLADFSKRGIALYLALGKLDIISNTTVVFAGDKRVLADIKILAENGYGEDKFGNNIVLPKELAYLRR